jgi:hypothetical protein
VLLGLEKLIFLIFFGFLLFLRDELAVDAVGTDWSLGLFEEGRSGWAIAHWLLID